METAYRLNIYELPDFIKTLKALFKKEKVIEITINPVAEKSLTKEETAQEYWSKLNGRIQNLDKRKNLVSFTGEEFEQLVETKFPKTRNGKRK